MSDASWYRDPDEPHDGAGDVLELAELARERRIRNATLIPFVVLGIIAGAFGGLGFALGMYGDGAATRGNPASLVFFVAPPIVLSAIGWMAYRLAWYVTARRNV